MLVQFLKEVLDAFQNVGLHVVATVCDMVTNNVKAMKLLVSTGGGTILPVSKSSNCNNI